MVKDRKGAIQRRFSGSMRLFRVQIRILHDPYDRFAAQRVLIESETLYIQTLKDVAHFEILLESWDRFCSL